MKHKLFITSILLSIILMSCDNPFKSNNNGSRLNNVLGIETTNDVSVPDGYGTTTLQSSEPTQSVCPYCDGVGILFNYAGSYMCPTCGGWGTVTNISFKQKSVGTLKKNKKCPNKSTTFECIDEHNNGIISTTDKCIHCDHMYYVHG